MYFYIIIATTATCAADAFRISTLRTIVSAEMLNISFRQKITHEILDQSQMIQHFNNAVSVAHSVDFFYMLLFFAAVILAVSNEHDVATARVKRIYITPAIERNIEIFFIIFMTLMTRDVEGVF